MKRREFLKKTLYTTGAVAAGDALNSLPLAAAQEPNLPEPPKFPTREYGKTGIQLSIIGFGGILVMNAEQKQADKLVAEAVERGVTYFDVAPSYGDAELKLGPALEPYRKNVFLACKTGQRQREGAQAELKQSLERLRTDHFDLYQLHAITDLEKDVDAVFAKSGAMEVFIEAKKQGIVRHLGFSAHSVEAALTAMDRFDFDSILFPINFATFYKGDFGPQVIQKAQEKKVAILALKALARQSWPQDDPQRQQYAKCWYQPLTDPREAELSLRFTLSQPVTAALPPGEEACFRMALNIAENFKPITPAELETLKQLAQNLNPIFTAQKPEA